MASVRQSSIVCRTIGCSMGTGIAPPGSVSGQATDLRETGRKQVVGPHAQERSRNPLAAARTLEQQRALHVPAPAGLEHRRGEERLDQDVARRVRVEVVEDLFEREAVLGPEREHDRLFVGRGLELEAEPDAEAFAQSEPPGAVDRRAEGSVHDELHAAALVEEALEDDALLRGHGAQTVSAGRDELGDLQGRGLGQRLAAIGTQSFDRLSLVGSGSRVFAQGADLGRELAGARPALLPARRGPTAAGPWHPPRGRRRARCARCARTCCRAGRHRRMSTRPPSLRGRVPTRVPSGSRSTR